LAKGWLPAYRSQMPSKAESTPADPIAVALGTRITEERERLGLSKEALGEKSHLASRYIWRVEDGRQNIQLRNLSRIASGLGLTMAQLLVGVEELAESPPPRSSNKVRRKPASRSASAE